MFCGQEKSSSYKGMLSKLTPVILCFILQFLSEQKAVKAAQVDLTLPTRADFATCTLTEEFKESFVDEHNRHRSHVQPPAADMEYLVGVKLKFNFLKNGLEGNILFMRVA